MPTEKYQFTVRFPHPYNIFGTSLYGSRGYVPRIGELVYHEENYYQVISVIHFPSPLDERPENRENRVIVVLDPAPSQNPLVSGS